MRPAARRVLALSVSAAALLAGSTLTHAAQLEGFNFFGESSPATSTPDIHDPNLDVFSVLSRGATAVSNGAGNSFRSTGFKNDGIAVGNTDYFEFSLSAASGYNLSLSTIDNIFNGTATYFATPGVQIQYGYSFDDSTFTLIGSPQFVTTPTPAAASVDLTTVSALQNVADTTTVYFRLFASGQTATGGFGYNNLASTGYGLNISGTLTPSGGGVVSNYFWIGNDSILGGAGTWDQSTTPSWSASDTTIAPVVWDSTKTATFSGAAAGVVTVNGTVNAGAGLHFVTTGYDLEPGTGAGTLNLSGATAISNAISSDTGVSTIINTPVTAPNGFFSTGNGTLIFTNAVTGNLTANGPIQIGNAGATGAFTGDIVNNSSIVFNRTADLTYSGAISGSGTLTQAGTNTLTLSGASSFSGAANVNTGVLRVANATALGNSTGATTVADGAALEISNAAVAAEPLNLSGTGIAGAGALHNVAGASSFGGPVTLVADSLITADSGTSLTVGPITGAAKNLTVGGAGDVTVSGAITTTTGTVDKKDAGTLTLSGTNTYTGLTVIEAGTLAVSGGSAIADAGTVLVGPGATFKLNSSERIAALTDDNSGLATVSLQANTLTVGDATDTTFSGVINGTGGLVKEGTGSVTLSGPSTYSGGTTVNTGTLRLAVAGGVTGAISVKATLLADAAATVANDLVVTGTPTVKVLSGYDFQTTTTGGTAITSAAATPTSFIANFGNGMLSLDGTNGSSTFLPGSSSPQVTSFGGTGLNAGPGFNTSGSGLAALALANSTANGFSGVFTLSTLGESGVTLSYATQGTGTGFKTQAFSYSLDGTTYTPLQTISSVPASFAVVTLNPLPSALDNQATVYIKLTVDGATSASGNNRFDNIQFDVAGQSVANSIIGSDATSGTTNYTGGVTLNSRASLTAGAGGTVNFTGTIHEGTAGVQGITKIGAGIVVLTGNNTFTGLTVVSAGTLVAGGVSGNASLGSTSAVEVDNATLTLGASNQINNSAAFTLNGNVADAAGAATLATGGFSEVGAGTTPGLGTLTLASNSILDFGTGASVLEFTGSGSVIAGALFINNWNSGSDRLLFSSSVDTSFLEHVQFAGFDPGAQQVAFNGAFEVVPIPEPSVMYAGLGVLGLGRWRRARKGSAVTA